MLTPEMWRTGFRLLNGGWEAWPQTHTKLELEPNHHKELDPLKLQPQWHGRLGKSHLSSKGHRRLTLNDSQLHVVKKPVFLRIWGHRSVFMQVCVSNLQYLHDHWNPSGEVSSESVPAVCNYSASQTQMQILLRNSFLFSGPQRWRSVKCVLTIKYYPNTGEAIHHEQELGKKKRNENQH